MQCGKPNRSELIELYLTGALADEEIESFEEHFFNCNLCFQELRIRYEVGELIKEEGELLFESYLERQAKKKEKEARKKTGARGFQLPQLPSFTRPMLVYATLLLLLVGAGSFLLVENFEESDPFQQYVFDNKVPSEFTPETVLRGASDTKDNASHHILFRQQFEVAMLAYRDLDYETAVESLNILGPAADELESRSTDKEILSSVRDYHFYLGASHLALSRSQKINLDETTRQAHLEIAIQQLSHSSTLAITNRLNLIDRDRFFLGLTHGLAGQWELAVEKLNRIDSSSPHFEKSSELVAKLARRQTKDK